MKKKIHLLFAFYLVLIFPILLHAAGMVPQSSVVIVEESDGEGNIDIKNTDKFPSLLVTKIEDLEEDTEELVIVSPSVIRVDGNETQTVRFLLSVKEPIKTERLKRVIFEGVPPKNKELSKDINVTFRQNLPMIIRPAGLAKNMSPWEGLIWKKDGDSLILENPTPYIIRFISNVVMILPHGSTLSLPKYYILPGQSITLFSSDSSMLDSATSIRLYPATTWGFSTNEYYEISLTR